MWPPSILRILIGSDGCRRISLWIPVFILWPLIFVVSMLSPVIARLSTKYCDEMPFRPGWLAGPRLWMAFVATRGIRVKVQDGDSQVFVALW